jgi:hypothetical protein
MPNQDIKLEYDSAKDGNMWKAPAGVVDYSGAPLVDNFFFAAPPDDIGDVVAAESMGLAEGPPRSAAFCVTIIILSVIPGIVAGIGVYHFFDAWKWALFFVLLGLGCGYAAWDKLGYKSHCSYVGNKGAVRYFYNGPLRAPSEQKIVFAQATELRISAEHKYDKLGIYQHTFYSFKWTDSAGRETLAIYGAHKARDGLPELHDPYHFAAAAGRAWSRFFFQQMPATIEKYGALTFSISPSLVVRVGQQFLDIEKAGTTLQRIDAGDIKHIKLQKDALEIQFTDSTHCFKFDEMPNAQLFTMAVEHYLGIKVQG